MNPEPYQEVREQLTKDAKNNEAHIPKSPFRFVEQTHAEGQYQYIQLKHQGNTGQLNSDITEILCQEYIEHLRLQESYEIFNQLKQQHNPEYEPGEWLETAHRHAIQYDKSHGHLDTNTGSMVDTDPEGNQQQYTYFPKERQPQLNEQHPVSHRENALQIAKQIPRDNIKENHASQQFNYSEHYRQIARGTVPETLTQQLGETLIQIGVGQNFKRK